MEQLCRVCTEPENRSVNPLVDIFTTTIELNQQQQHQSRQISSGGHQAVNGTGEDEEPTILIQTIAQAMVSCLDVEIKPNDELPHSICHNCMDRLKETWNLRELCKASEKKLKFMVEEGFDIVKQEIFKEESFEVHENEVPGSPFEVLKDSVEPETSVFPSSSGKSSDPTKDSLHSEFSWSYADLAKGRFRSRSGEDHTWDIIEITDSRCCGCFKFFTSRSAMANHRAKEHKALPHGDRNKRFECNGCMQLFSSTDAMNFHQKMARARQLFHCIKCDILSPSKRQLKAHLRIHALKPLTFDGNEHVSKGSGISGPLSESDSRFMKKFITFDYFVYNGYYCCDCWTYCETKREMKRHGEKEHQGNRGFDEDYQCFACLKSFPTEDIFKQHMNELETQHAYYCKTCKLLFRNAETLKQHQQSSSKHEGFFELEIIDVQDEIEIFKPTSSSSIRESHQMKRVQTTANNDYEDDAFEDENIPENGDSNDEDYEPNASSVQEKAVKEPYGRRLYAPVVTKRNDPDLTEGSVVEISSTTRFRCCGCYQSFLTEEELDQHALNTYQHSNEQLAVHGNHPYQCQRCFRQFDKAVSLLMHQLFVRTVLLYRCKLCPREFDFQSLFIRHYITHEEVFNSVDKRGPKPKTSAEKIDNKFYCCFTACKESYLEYNSLLAHVDDNHGVKRNQFKDYRDSDENCCEICFRSFNNYRALIRHMSQQQRPIMTGGYTCSTCGIQKKSIATLRDHENIHTGAKPYKCDVCSKAFSSKTILNNHMIVHRQERPFSCEICGKTFARKRNWKDHAMTHTDERPWECEICKLTFRIETQFLTHKRRHTGVRPYKCSFCDKVYSHATDRKRHEMAAHTGVKPHQCSFCPLAFIRKRQLIIHERTHTGEKPFECQYCGQAFIQQGYLTRHLATHKPRADALL
ncbi:zinc finger protein 709-like [Uranotaenia lowii]|uniref:zinc finger protein 709-like n=1 Tax=Uranotaenia lowii TaxID=190385 RepID=UPI00247AC99C|nr:zinc finger protein 709-like [Uranotaenia lowii]XP_055591720.1 zinc finger protein 709-like [Uranotaenia lowii]